MKKYVRDWLESLFEAGIILAILYLFFWPVTIKGHSMEKEFYDGDKVAISRALAITNNFDIGDIVVVSVNLFDENVRMIKRIIAEEGDRITIKNGLVHINEKIFSEPYAVGYTKGDIDLVVPKDCVFVMGDNREESVDSRHFGIFEKSKVKGKVLIKLFPFS